MRTFLTGGVGLLIAAALTLAGCGEPELLPKETASAGGLAGAAAGKPESTRAEAGSAAAARKRKTTGETPEHEITEAEAAARGRDPFSYVKVSGTVTYDDGTKIPGEVHVYFSSETPHVGNKYPKQGIVTLTKNGEFHDVTSHYFADGIVRGKHKVTLRGGNNSVLPPSIVPPEYCDAKKTPLEVDTGDAPFHLKVKKPDAAGTTPSPADSAASADDGKSPSTFSFGDYHPLGTGTRQQLHQHLAAAKSSADTEVKEPKGTGATARPAIPAEEHPISPESNEESKR